MTLHTTARPASDPSGVTGTLAEWIAGVRPEDVPDRVRERAAHLVLDGLACALIGARLPWSQVAVDAVRRIEGTGTSTLIGWGEQLPGPAACLLNGTFIQGFELDDYHPRAPLHSNSLILPSLIATVEEGDEPVSGADFLTAAVVGFEVGPRVGLALHGMQMLSRGWHSGSVFGTHASAAASGWLRHLDAAAIEDTLGLAATQSAGLMAAQYEAMSKRMHHGFSARNGYYAAALAEGGYTGIKRVFERPYGGLLATFGEGHDPDAAQIAADLGTVWETECIAVKAYAAMAGTHSSIDAMLALRADGLVAADVDAIDIWVSHGAYHHGWWPPVRPLETIGAQMNIGYVVAAALLDGQVLAQQFTSERIDSDDIWRLLERTHVHHDPAFDRSDTTQGFNTLVRVITSAGEVVERAVSSPTGGEQHPLSNAAVRAKCRALLTDTVDNARWDAIEHDTLALDELGDVHSLVAQLAAPTHAASVRS